MMYNLLSRKGHCNLNNDDRNRDRENNQREDRRGQQFFPGNFPQTPQQPPFIETQPRTMPGTPPSFPGMGDMPRTAPPNFIPEAPGMQRGPMAGPGQMPYEFGRRYPEDHQVRPRDLRRCLYRFTFIWLNNGNSFWFFPTFVGNQFVQGFRWRQNRWEYDRINLRRIFFFRCF